jgi:hypothetical protein
LLKYRIKKLKYIIVLINLKFAYNFDEISDIFTFFLLLTTFKWSRVIFYYTYYSCCRYSESWKVFKHRKCKRTLYCSYIYKFRSYKFKLSIPIHDCRLVVSRSCCLKTVRDSSLAILFGKRYFNNSEIL